MERIEWSVCVLRGGERGPIYTTWRSVSRQRIYGRWSGALAVTPPRDAPGCIAGQVRSTLWVGRPHLSAVRADPLLGGWFVGSYPYPLVHLAWRPHFLWHVGPLCKGVTPDVIFCVVVRRLLRVFVLFRSCSSEMYKTWKQLWSKVSDTNMWVRCIVFLYYWV